jgi:hypothetical protein
MLEALYQKLYNELYFQEESPVLLELFHERRFHCLPKFLHVVNSDSNDETICISKGFHKS